MFGLYGARSGEVPNWDWLHVGTATPTRLTPSAFLHRILSAKRIPDHVFIQLYTAMDVIACPILQNIFRTASKFSTLS